MSYLAQPSYNCRLPVFPRFFYPLPCTVQSINIMPLAPGTRLGPYEILALIGKGGMGEVYRAKRAHQRDYAREPFVKVLRQTPEPRIVLNRKAQVEFSEARQPLKLRLGWLNSLIRPIRWVKSPTNTGK